MARRQPTQTAEFVNLGTDYTPLLINKTTLNEVIQIEDLPQNIQAVLGGEDAQPREYMDLPFKDAKSQLIEDFELAGVPEAVADTFLLGCVYGTGIAIINVEVEDVPQFEGPPVRKFKVSLEAVRPDEFFIDPAAKSIKGALFNSSGCSMLQGSSISWTFACPTAMRKSSDCVTRR